MRHERDDSLARAAGIISDRITALPEFAYARNVVVQTAIARVVRHGTSVASLRELGGFTFIVANAIEQLPPAYRTNVGSKLVPRCIADELHARIGELRADVQRGVARAVGL